MLYNCVDLAVAILLKLAYGSTRLRWQSDYKYTIFYEILAGPRLSFCLFHSKPRQNVSHVISSRPMRIRAISINFAIRLFSSIPPNRASLLGPSQPKL